MEEIGFDLKDMFCKERRERSERDKRGTRRGKSSGRGEERERWFKFDLKDEF